MTFAILELIFLQMIVPAAGIGVLLFAKFKGRLDWILHVLFTTVLISWVFFSGRWDFTSYYLRILWPLLLMAGIYFSWRRVRFLTRKRPYSGKNKWGFAFLIVMTLVFGFYHIPIFNGYVHSNQAINLEFPLQNGMYYVGHGGASTSINYHYEHPKQQYALDIVQLNKLGVRASGLYPHERDAYTIYGAELSSPCPGTVVKSRDDMPNLTPPDTNPDKPYGNYIQIECEQNSVKTTIAHMQKGSITPEKGDEVQSGDPIGKVGNSGNTSEPHLHIQAEKNGKGVPIEFDGRFLVRNSLVWK